MRSTQSMFLRPGICLLLLVTSWSTVAGHDGPDPRAHWVLGTPFFQDGNLKSQLGPNLTGKGSPLLEDTDGLNAIR
ncbi:MAG: metallophosphoesterase, partial [Rhodopirellula sp. JB055]